MKKIYSLFLLLILALFALKINTYHEVEAASYDSYYANVDVSSGENLQKSLTTIISDGYNGISYSGLWDAYKTTDCKPGTNYIWDMYSNYNYVVGGSKQGANYSGEGDSYNREHSIPQSWFNEASPMKSDLFHVYPTDGYVNNMRGNYVFGETDNPTKTSGNGSKLGPSSNSLYNGTVFEPIDEYKGDFARTYFYMATRYRTLVGNWGGNATAVFKGSYPYLTNYSVDLFMKWHAEDPVSEKETSRNDAVYAIQKNRNPFIDHPEYANFIWGDGTLEVPGSTYTVSYECGDGITFDYTDTTEYESGDKVATPTVSPNRVGFEFIGWTIDEKTKVLWDFDANTISSNLTFYPVWEVSTVEAFISDCSKVSSQLLMNFETTELSTYTTIEGYSLVTDITELSINDNIIITDISSSYALSTTQNSNNRAVASISVTDSVITTVPSDVQVITLEAGTATNSFAFNVGNGYLYAASSGSNWLRTQTSIDDNASFKIEISSDGYVTDYI